MLDIITHSGVPSIDYAAIETFVDVVFAGLEGHVPVRAFSEKGTPDQKPLTEFHLPENLTSALKRLAGQADQQSRGVFVVPAAVDEPGSAKSADIRQTRVVVVDLDAGDIEAAVRHLTTHLGIPNLDVASGGTTADGEIKRHLYWTLMQPAKQADLERVRAIREMIAVKVGADLSFRSLHQPIRVTGTIHGKGGVKSSVSILDHHPQCYDLDALEKAARAMPPLVEFQPRTEVTSGSGTGLTYRALATRPVHAAGVDGITRFEALSNVIGHWIRLYRRGEVSLKEAWKSVVDHNAALIVPPWEEDNLRREFDALLRNDVQEKGPIASPPSSVEAGMTPHSDDALAAAFVTTHGKAWRHVAIWGAWFCWQNGKWAQDETGEVRELARLVCRKDALGADKPGEGRRIASDKTIAAVLRIAAHDRQVATPSAAFDVYPWLLNTPQGVVDLKSGELRPHDPQLMLTQMTKASPGEGCQRWTAFLAEITNDDEDLQAYLARFAGYCLTGSTSEQVFAFFHGWGANGKSVFLHALAAVMGDYAKTAANDTFMATRSERHLTEIAGLRAARLVVVPETEHDRTWAEARIKAVTGGEKIRANFMRQDHFEFTPQFKLIVAGNHRPALTGVGEAMRRRLHVVPFTVTIPPEHRDKDLSQKLLAEIDGILGWAIAGCLQWQEIGLRPPACIATAADEYFASEDTIGLWIEDCCCMGAQLRAAAAALFKSWCSWARDNGHEHGTQKMLGSALKDRGCVACKVSGQRGWQGIGLKGSSQRERTAE